MSPCDNCSSFDFSCTGNCKPFGTRLRIKSFKHKARNLVEQIEQSRMMIDAMTPAERDEMIRKQGESWARSEAQWVDFREGKCDRG